MKHVRLFVRTRRQLWGEEVDEEGEVTGVRQGVRADRCFIVFSHTHAVRRSRHVVACSLASGHGRRYTKFGAGGEIGRAHV